MFYTVSQIPEFTQWPTKSNLLNNTLIISFLPLLDSFPHSPPELHGITLQINYLPQILLLTFWLQFRRSNPSNPYLREHFWGKPPKAIIQFSQGNLASHQVAELDYEPRSPSFEDPTAFRLYIFKLQLSSSLSRNNIEVGGENRHCRNNSGVF